MSNHIPPDAPFARHPWRAILDELGVRPSKGMGQNFLHDMGVVRRIIDVSKVGSDDTVLEVGPGLGVLTAALSERASRVVAVELDARLASRLRDRFKGSNVDIVEADFLKIEPADLSLVEPYGIVANLPYSVAAAAITHALESRARPNRMTVMVQREVAQRIVAAPPDMSVLAVGVQFHGVPKIRLRIGRGAFIPPPKVDSAVVQIDVRRDPPLVREHWPGFFAVVRAGFAQRRKRLANSLSSVMGLDKSAVEAACRRAGIDPSRRAETLTVEEWVDLYRQIGAVPSDAD
jgi:16S rRNA (adenine1518-N6/adenine1519-N6)-dimethyltransferase